MVARPSSVPEASSTTATTVPLSTLAVPETSTGELIALLPSGLSMMIFRFLGIGVAAVMGREEVSGEVLVAADGEALAEAALAVGVPLVKTYVVVLSPPHPAIAIAATPTSNPTLNPFISL